MTIQWTNINYIPHSDDIGSTQYDWICTVSKLTATGSRWWIKLDVEYNGIPIRIHVLGAYPKVTISWTITNVPLALYLDTTQVIKQALDVLKRIQDNTISIQDTYYDDDTDITPSA